MAGNAIRNRCSLMDDPLSNLNAMLRLDLRSLTFDPDVMRFYDRKTTLALTTDGVPA